MNIDHERLNAHLAKVAFYYDIAGLVAGVGIGEACDHSGAGRPAGPDGLLYQGAAGFKNMETGEPMNTGAVFHMASVTKLFVGTAIMQLVEKGLIDLDEPMIKYLPWFVMADERYRKITTRQLLTHTAGLSDVLDYHWEDPETDEGALKRYVTSEEVFNASLLWDPDGRRFAYSNIGYEILGVMIAEISGKTFEEQVADSIFKPLGMTNSTLLTFERDFDNVSAPHFKNASKAIEVARVFPYNRAHAPSSTLTSDISDIGKWGRAHLGKKILKTETYDEVWRKYALVPNNGEQICLSWFAREQAGYQLFGHEGTDDGFRSSFWICPELDLYITVNANMTGAPVKKINKQIFDILLGYEPKL